MTEPRDQDPPLHGKQLVFVFMAATVAAVVVFLAGVMVGRGVRLQRGAFFAGEMAADPTLDPAPPLAAPTGTTAQGPSPASREGLSYPTQLSELNPPDVLAEPAEDPTAEVLGRTPPKAQPKAPPVKEPSARPAPPVKADPAPLAKALLNAQLASGAVVGATAGADAPRAGAKATTSAPADGVEAGPGYAVQVAAVRDRSEADRIAARLKGKGYTTYITSPAPGMFRVRVGKFEHLREAESAAAKLEKEEQFKPWITK